MRKFYTTSRVFVTILLALSPAAPAASSQTITWPGPDCTTIYDGCNWVTTCKGGLIITTAMWCGTMEVKGDTLFGMPPESATLELSPRQLNGRAWTETIDPDRPGWGIRMSIWHHYPTGRARKMPRPRRRRLERRVH